MCAWMSAWLGGGLTGPWQSEAGKHCHKCFKRSTKVPGDSVRQEPSKKNTCLGYESMFCSSYTSPATHLTGHDVNTFWRRLTTFAHPKKPHPFRSFHESRVRDQQVRDQVPWCQFPPVCCNCIRYVTGCPLPHRVQGTRRPSQPWGITG